MLALISNIITDYQQRRLCKDYLSMRPPVAILESILDGIMMSSQERGALDDLQTEKCIYKANAFTRPRINLYLVRAHTRC